MTAMPTAHSRLDALRATLRALKEVLSKCEQPHALSAVLDHALATDTCEAMRAAIARWYSLPLAQRDRIAGAA